jgi:glycosyltransferase involved in cell wall biosynthesis
MRILVNEFCGHPFQIELSRELARRGHEVLHLYFADNLSTPKGDLSARGAPGLRIEGLHIAHPFSKHSLLTRRRSDRAYGKEVAKRLAEFQPEAVLSANMPLDGQKILLDAARQQHARFYYWLQDVYSSAVRFVVQRKFPLLADAAASHYLRLERRLLRDSDGVICIAPGFARMIEEWGVPRREITVIENWMPLHEVVPVRKDNAWAREQGLTERFRFLYSGTLGMKHRPDLLLALARELEDRGDGEVVVVAGGAGAEWLRAQAGALALKTLKIFPYQPYERIAEVLGSADVLIALLDSEAGAFAVPSKVLSYLCAARPLLLAAPRENHSWTVVSEAEAGITLSPDDGQAFLQAARHLLQNPELCQRYGHNARRWAEEHFEIFAIASRFLHFMRRPDAWISDPRLSTLQEAEIGCAPGASMPEETAGVER